jgi:hypothetical protein
MIHALKSTALAAIVVVVSALAGTARADKYQELAAKSSVLPGAEDIAGLFWSTTVDCSKAGDDLARRQCEGVRQSRADAAASGQFVVAGDALSFWVGEWDAKKSGLPIAVYGCIACGQAADLAGQQRFLTIKGDVKVEASGVRGPVLHKALRKFKSEADAKKWKDTVVPRLRAQFIVKLPAKPSEWQAGAARGFAVEMVGFRVWDPCDGAMVCSEPPSAQEKADRAACKGGQASGTDISGEGEGDGEAKPKLPEKAPEPADTRPEKLSSSQVKDAMRPAQAAVNACFSQYGVPGKADLVMEIGGDGKVKKVELRGEFKDTPTGECIVQAVQATEFPPFRSASMIIKYPFILR